MISLGTGGEDRPQKLVFLPRTNIAHEFRRREWLDREMRQLLVNAGINPPEDSWSENPAVWFGYLRSAILRKEEDD